MRQSKPRAVSPCRNGRAEFVPGISPAHSRVNLGRHMVHSASAISGFVSLSPMFGWNANPL